MNDALRELTKLQIFKQVSWAWFTEGDQSYRERCMREGTHKARLPNPETEGWLNEGKLIGLDRKQIHEYLEQLITDGFIVRRVAEDMAAFEYHITLEGEAFENYYMKDRIAYLQGELKRHDQPA